MPGGRNLPDITPTKGFAGAIVVKNFPSGEKRITRGPLKSRLELAFEEFGTHKAVAAAFGVSRGTVRRWLRNCRIDIVSRPEVLISKSMLLRLRSKDDCLTLAQWLMDEGSVSVDYLGTTDLTYLVVGGGMNDYEVLSHLSSILGVAHKIFQISETHGSTYGSCESNILPSIYIAEGLEAYVDWTEGERSCRSSEFLPIFRDIKGEAHNRRVPTSSMERFLTTNFA